MEYVIRLSQQEVYWQLHMEGYYSRVAIHKAPITKMDAHLTVQWCKKHRNRSTEMWEKKWYGEMSHLSPYSRLVGEHMCGVHQENSTSLNAWPLQCGDPVALLNCGDILLPWFDFKRLVESMSRSTEAVLAAQHLSKTFCFLPLFCHPSSYFLPQTAMSWQKLITHI